MKNSSSTVFTFLDLKSFQDRFNDVVDLDDEPVSVVIDDIAGLKGDNPGPSASARDLKLDNISSGIDSKPVVFESKLIEEAFKHSQKYGFESGDLYGDFNLNVKASTWNDEVRLSRVVDSSRDHHSSDILQAKQVDKNNWSGPVGSLLNGSNGNDVLRGLAGWDLINGGDGNDLIHGGNGRDIIVGGDGSDELHGDFGWNTYTSQDDGRSDLIVIKSDQHLYNWWYGKSGNSPNGEKADVIEELDRFDEVKIVGVFTDELAFREGTYSRGGRGIGIYAKGSLEAVYTGSNLGKDDLERVTSGDGSAIAMNNQVWSYWGENTVPALRD